MTTVIAFVVVIGLLILIHELGHFIVARLSGVGVERFSIGFGPVLWRVRGKETEYCLSAIPMGGYVKMMGAEENPLEGGKGGLVDPAKAFDGKSLAVRFLIVFAGPGMNFVLAAVICALIFMLVGRPAVPSLIGRVVDGGPAAQAGLRVGDRIAAVDGQPVEYWEEILRRVHDKRGQPLQLTVRGEAAERRVSVTPVRVVRRDPLGDEQEFWDLGAHYASAGPAKIGDVVPDSPAANAGLRGGDTVVSVDAKPMPSWEDLAAAIRARPGQRIELVVRRGEETLTLSVVATAVKDRGPDGQEIKIGRIGISAAPATTPGVVFVRSSPIVALWEGVLKTAEWTDVTVRGAYKLIVGQLDRSNIGGPIQIAAAAGEQARQGWTNLALFTAVISVNLAVLNLLPVPMLDGGHLLFFVCEAVLGRPLSVRKREVAQQVGFVLLMLLMGYAVYNDLARIDVFRLFR